MMTKNAGVEREPKHEEKRPDFESRMKAAPNWQAETYDPDADVTADRFHIDPSLIPEGMSAQWITDSVFGQPQTSRRSLFEKGGWTPVHGEDFEGQFNGMFMPKDAAGEIKLDGMTLMMRPSELTDRAKRKEERAAREKVAQQDYALKEGGMQVAGARDPSAVASNRINKSFERLDIPND